MNKKLLSSFLLLLCFVPAVHVMAQYDPAKTAPPTNLNDLKNYLSVIASDSMEGRETGTSGQRKAAHYIAEQFSQLGLTPAPGTNNFQQYFPVGYDTLLLSVLSVGKKKYREGIDYVNELPLNSDKKVKADGYVFAGYGISDVGYDDYANKDVKGKLVIIFSGEPKKDNNYLLTGTDSHSDWVYINKKAETAMQKGAVGLIMIRPSLETISVNTAKIYRKSLLHMLEDEPRTINCVLISHGFAAELLGKHLFDTLLARAHWSESLDTYNYSSNQKMNYVFKGLQVTVQSSNVVGWLEGTDKKDEYVILTGHYDHMGMKNGKIWHGADDDGSGTSAVLAMAAAFSRAKAEGISPRRSVIFMTVSGEEEGLWGSEFYSSHPLFPLSKTSIDINTDMVGRIDPKRNYGDSMNYLYVIGDDKLSSDLAPIVDSVNNKWTRLEVDRKFNDLKDPNKFYYRSDHFNFAKKGVPVIFLFNGTHRDYHQPSDTVDKINWDLYGKRVEFIYRLAWEMANREDMIRRNIPLPSLDD